MGKPSFVLIHLIQPYDAFYMVGVGEHVYGLNFFGAIAALCKKIKVARERFRVTRDVYDASRCKCERAGEKRGVAAGARRIHEKYVAVFTGVCHIYHEVACIGTDEADIFHTV